VGALGALVLVLGAALVRTRSRVRAQATYAHAETALLRERIAEVERRLAADAKVQTAPDAEFVITELGIREVSPDPPALVPARIDGRLFADVVLRESVVKAASLVYGVRRALAPEARFRVRYAMKREVKRSRKERRAELREARRFLQRRQRVMNEDAA